MIDFRDQVVIVSGAGRGLGRLYAVELAQRGAAVVVNDVGGSMSGDGSDTRVADAVVDEIQRAGGVAIASHDSVDTSDGGAAIVRAATERFGRLDAVVSNAGIFHTAPFTELSTEDWERMRRVHLDGAFHLSQPAFRVMQAQGYGRFVFITSSAGLFGQPNSAHYAAAKAGTVGLANVIAIEGQEHGILANCVLPFGYSRMVTETVGDRDELEPERFLARHRTGARRPCSRLSRQPGVRVDAPLLLRVRWSIRSGVHRARRRLGRGSRQQSDRGRPRDASRRGLRRRAVHHPHVDLRRGVQGVRSARPEPVSGRKSHRGVMSIGKLAAVRIPGV